MLRACPAFSFLLAATAAVCLSISPSRLAAQTPLAGDSVVSFRIRFGMTDSEPRSWNGRLEITNGEVLHLRNWNPHPSEQIIATTGWSLATRKGVNYPRRVYQWEDPRGTVEFVYHPGVVVDVKTTRSTRLRITTPQGGFDVWPRELRLGRSLSFLDGAVVVDRVASAERLSSSDYESDFATVLGGQGPSSDDGEVWAAWVAYRDKANVILARRFDGASWGDAEQISEESGDIFIVKMGRDNNGRPWVVWSEQVGGNFDLYGRYRDGDRWSATQRLTTAPEPGVQHSLTTDSRGNLWLVWQGFREGKSDVFARRYGGSDGGSSWSPEEKVSISPANDWKPAIAADGKGRVYVAWDTYDKGNYDVLMRRWSEGSWSDIIPIAETPKFEAHVTLACDHDDRVWAAWNESGFQWGKDSGFMIYKEATRLYQWRSLGVAVWGNGRWQVPASDINRALSKHLPEYGPEFNDLPVLQLDGDGRMWLFFRHRKLRARDTPDFTPAHRAAWQIYGTAFVGDRWTEPLHLPFSRSRQDVRWGLAADGDGSLFAAWSTDNRNSDDYYFQHSDVYAAKLPGLASEPKPPKLKEPEQRVFTTYPVHPNEADDLERIRNYTIESGGKTYRIYRGDTHRHTEFSDDGYSDGSLFETTTVRLEVE